MLACLPQIANAYDVPLPVIERTVAAARSQPSGVGPMGIPQQWIPVLSAYGFAEKAVRNDPCWGVAAGVWILALQRRESSSMRFLAHEAQSVTGVPAGLLLAVAWKESGFNPKATSKAGARGLMQLMPTTWKAYGEGHIYNAHDSMMAGAKYLAALIDRYKGNVRLALAAYNAGPTAVARAGYSVPSWKETRAYVPAVIGRWRQITMGGLDAQQ